MIEESHTKSEPETSEEELFNLQCAAIGYFIVCFEGCVHQCRRGILSELEHHGLKNLKIGQILIEHSKSSASLILEVWHSIMGQAGHRKDKDDIQTKVIDYANKELRALIGFRNQIGHATYYLGLPPRPGFDEMAGKKGSPSKDGMKFTELAEMEEIREWGDRARDHSIIIQMIRNALEFQRKSSDDWRGDFKNRFVEKTREVDVEINGKKKIKEKKYFIYENNKPKDAVD